MKKSELKSKEEKVKTPLSIAILKSYLEQSEVIAAQETFGVEVLERKRISAKKHIKDIKLAIKILSDLK